MTEQRFKMYLGAYIITLNLGLVLFVLGCFLKGGLYEDQLTTVIAVIVPMFTCYGSAAIRHIMNQRFVQKSENSNPVPITVAILSIGVPFIFTAVIAGAIFLQAQGKAFKNFEDFKRILFILEGAFSVYIGQAVYSMFQREDDALEHEPKTTEKL